MFSLLINSNAFVGLATMLTGAVAIAIYYRQKGDAKVNAARLLLMEIRAAEESIAQIQQKVATHNTVDFPRIFATKSWDTYAHLFVQDFDQDELKLLSTFYEYCELIDEFARKSNAFLWLNTEEKARVYQQILGRLIYEAHTSTDATNADELNAKLHARREAVIAALDADSRIFAPKATLFGMNRYLPLIQRITTSTCGQKLKRLAKEERPRFFLARWFTS
jgi:hypothetical protein